MWLDDDEWMSRAKCLELEIPTPLFFPDNNDYEKPRRICNECVVRTDCLTWSLLLDQHHGMWGGMTPEERESYTHAVDVDYRHPSEPQ